MKSRYSHAVALSYHEGSTSAPEVVVSGELLSPDQIVKIAEQHGIPVVRREELARVLSGLPLDQPIPTELYEVVASILIEIKAFNRKTD